MSSTKARWFRVIGFGRSGPPCQSPDEAWARFYRGVPEWAEGSIRSATSATLVEATTRRAAADADVSVASGRCGAGAWWRA
jgi:hypothetical protein